MANILITFLGTNDYLECNYCLETGECVANVRFIQEALVKLCCADFTAEDQILVFVTSEAREKNWVDSPGRNGRLREGLQGRLRDCPAEIRAIEIPGGNTEDEIRQIFTTVYDQLGQNDQIVLDITHGFRSLPMLAIVLLNYAGFLKQTTIRGIYYGAFEALGPAYKVKDMPIEERNAPVFNLTGFDALLQWSFGADNFVTYGNPARINALLEDRYKSKLRETKGKDEMARQLRGLAVSLEQLADQIVTNRGAELVAGTTVEKLLGYASSLADTELPALRPILAAIEKKAKDFQANNVHNGLVAVKWCIEHRLIQQGLTMLQESALTLLMDKLKLDWKVKKQRELVNFCINIYNQKIAPQQWNDCLKEDEELSKKIIHSSLLSKMASHYDALSKVRNDINHAGFNDPRNADKFGKVLEEQYSAMLEIFNQTAKLPDRVE